MFLGLDLKGGVHFLLQVDKSNIMTNMIREIEIDVKKHLILNKYRYKSIHQAKEMLIIEFNNQVPAAKIIESIKKEFPELIVNQIKSNNIITLNITPTISSIDNDTKSAFEPEWLKNGFWSYRDAINYKGIYNFNLDNSAVFGIEKEWNEMDYEKNNGQTDAIDRRYAEEVVSQYIDFQSRLTNNLYFI